MKTLKILLIMTLAGSAFFTSCKKKGCTDHHADNYDAKAKKDDGSCTYAPTADTETDFRIMFHHKSGTQDLELNTTYVDDYGNDYQFTRTQMYICNPRFFDDNGNLMGDHHHNAYALISHDIETYNLGHVPVGHINSMQFIVGVDSVTNLSDPSTYAIGHPLANQSPTTHWNWNTGYVFIILEGRVDMDGNGTYDTGEIFLFHVGLDANRTTVSINAHFNSIANVASTVHLDLNWAHLLNNINLSVDNITHSMGTGAQLAGRIRSNVSSSFTFH